MNVMGWELHRHYSIMDYGCLGESPLPDCNHPTEWVQTKLTDMGYFKGKALPSPECRTRVCQYLQDTYALRQEIVISDYNIVTTVYNMIGGYRHSRVPLFHRSPHFTIVTRYMHFTFWLCDCLDCFEDVLK